MSHDRYRVGRLMPSRALLELDLDIATATVGIGADPLDLADLGDGLFEVMHHLLLYFDRASVGIVGPGEEPGIVEASREKRQRDSRVGDVAHRQQREQRPSVRCRLSARGCHFAQATQMIPSPKLSPPVFTQPIVPSVVMALAVTAATITVLSLSGPTVDWGERGSWRTPLDHFPDDIDTLHVQSGCNCNSGGSRYRLVLDCDGTDIHVERVPLITVVALQLPNGDLLVI